MSDNKKNEQKPLKPIVEQRQVKLGRLEKSDRDLTVSRDRPAPPEKPKPSGD